jgi:hypothetical protein
MARLIKTSYPLGKPTGPKRKLSILDKVLAPNTSLGPSAGPRLPSARRGRGR